MHAATFSSWTRWSGLWIVPALLLLALGARAADEDEDAGDGGFEIEEEAYADEGLRDRLMQPDNELEAGLRWSSDGDLLYRRYLGIPDDFSALANVDLNYRDPFGSGDTSYLRFQGLNLGLDSRYIQIDQGFQGTYDAYFLFRQLPTTDTTTAKSIFNRMGENYLALPGGWVAGDEADAPPLSDSIDANLHGVDIERLRRIYGGGVGLNLPDGFDFEANVHHENRFGELLEGGVIGYSGGNPRSVLMPDRIEWETTNVDAALRYTGEQFQLQLGYLGSRFSNDGNPLLWDNPYLADPEWNPAAGFPTGQGRMGQPPDNWFHQIQASGGVSLAYNTRITLQTAFGWMLQNEDFQPYTVNPALLVPEPLPRSSLDGEIFTTLVDFRVASRPLPKLNLNLHYRFDNRDNQTPRDTYLTVGGDSENQPTVDEDGARINRPYSFEINHVDAQAGYEILPRTNFTLGGEWERIDRDYQEVSVSNEYSLIARLRSRPCSQLSGRIDYIHSWRDASNYVGTRPLVSGETPELLVGFDPAVDWENYPLLRKYNQADRERDQVNAVVSWMPVDVFTVGLNARYALDDYNDTEIGLTESQTVGGGIDLSYVPIQRLSTHVFYNYDWTQADQAGWSTRGFAKLADAANPGRRWWVDNEDKIHTVGAGVRFDVIPERLDLGVDYIYMHATGGIDLLLGSTLAGGDPPNQAYPDLLSRVHDVNVTSNLQITRNLSFRVGYLYENFDSHDWQVDGVTPTTLTEVIASGRSAPHYTAHVVTGSVVYRFWKWPGK